MTVELTVALLLVSSGSRNWLVLLKSALAELATVVPQTAAPSNVPVIVYEINPFAGSVTFDVLMLPLPEASQLAPVVAVQVQETPVTEAGTLSRMVGDRKSVV